MRWSFGPNRSIGRTLTFYTILLTVFSLLLTGSASLYLSHGTQKREILLSSEKTAQRVALGIGSHLEKAAAVLGVFAGAQDLSSMDPSPLGNALARLLAQQRRIFNELIYIDHSGQEKARVSTFRMFQPEELDNRSQAPEFQIPASGHTFVGPIYISRQGNVPVTLVAVPVTRGGAVIGGVLLAEVTLKKMWDIVSEMEQDSPAQIYVVDREGRLVACKELTEIYFLFGRSMKHVPEVRRFLAHEPWSLSQEHEYKGFSGARVIGSYAGIEGAQWGVIVEIPVRTAFHGIQRLILSMTGLLLLSILVAAAINRLIIRRVTSGLDLLRHGAERIGKGELDYRIEVEGEDELGVLAKVFNSMAAQLRGMIDNLEQRVAERERAEAFLRESENKYRSLLESTVDWVWTCDLEARITFSNEAIQPHLGYLPEEIRNRPFADFIHPDDRPGLGTLFNGSAEDRTGWRNVTFRRIHRDGSTRFFDSTAQPLLDTQGNVTGITGIDRDITERKQAQDTLKESEERFRHISELSPFGISITERGGDVTYLNRKFREIFGYTQEDISCGRDWFRKAFPDPVKRHEIISAWISDNEGPGAFEVKSRECEVTCKDGTVRPVLFTSVSMEDGRWCTIYEDLTDRKRIEQELLKIQKLESVGLLAGGIAHDFNNLLTGIIGSISLAITDAVPGSRIHRWLEEAQKASSRAKELTQQLLTFSRGGTPIRKMTSLKDVIVDSCEFALRGSRSQCRFDIHEDLWLVEVDEGQISQVISNIAINAGQAMQNGGNVIVEAVNLVLDPGSEIPLDPGNYVRISIRDEGPGIDKEVLPKIFDPYFTTKPKGSGLGLATVYAIVKKHDGHIVVASPPGQGATFHVLLPASAGESLPDTTAGRVEACTGKGRILIMDDEEIVLQVAGEMLSYLGYEVHFAHDGEMALEMYRREMGGTMPFDAVLLDLTVPGGMGGKETMSRLLEMDPNVRSIVSSGYSSDPIMATPSGYGFRGVVSKPYKIEELAEVVHRVLNGL